MDASTHTNGSTTTAELSDEQATSRGVSTRNPRLAAMCKIERIITGLSDSDRGIVARWFDEEYSAYLVTE